MYLPYIEYGEIMKIIIKNLFIILTLLFIVSQILINSSYIIDAVKISFNLWINNIFPSLFPFFVFSSLLINYGFVELISELFKPIMYFLFKSSGNSSFIFIMSMLSGIPSNAKYINNLIDNDMLDIKEANKLLLFTQFSNPLFILGTIGTLLLNNYKLGIIILISHYSSNFILGLLLRNYYPCEKSNVSIKRAIRNMNKKIKNSQNFGKVISTILVDSLNTTFLILGVITFFLIITTIVNRCIRLDEISRSILNGLFEITQGLNSLSKLSINTNFKVILMTFIISFGGVSSHIQVMSILSEKKIRYIPYLISRLFCAIISVTIVILLLN